VPIAAARLQSLDRLELSDQFRRPAARFHQQHGPVANSVLELPVHDTPENFIWAIGETSDASLAYPSAAQQTASYNSLNQLTNLETSRNLWANRH
jgi:hypothetical protein